MIVKQGVEKYVNTVKKLFTVFACLAIPAFMVCLVFAFAGVKAFWAIAPAVGILFLVVYSLYALRVSMGTVTGIEVTDTVVHLKTKRKIFTYDRIGGCASVKTYKNKFVCVFRTEDSQDKFVFLRRAPFSRYYEEQFLPDEVRLFYPDLDE